MQRASFGHFWNGRCWNAEREAKLLFREMPRHCCCTLWRNRRHRDLDVPNKTGSGGGDGRMGGKSLALRWRTARVKSRKFRSLDFGFMQHQV